MAPQGKREIDMKKVRIVVIAVLVLALLLGLGAVGLNWYREKQYREAHVFVEDVAYPVDAVELDLRGSGISAAHYEQLRSLLPNCRIWWDVPFQGGLVSNNVNQLTITALTEDDIAVMEAYLPELTTVDAQACSDYAMLEALQQRLPDCQVQYQVELAGRSYPLDTAALELQEADGAELLERLQYLPAMQQIHFTEPQLEAGQLLALVEAYPDIAFTWEKTVLDTVYDQDLTELDLSGTALEGVEDLEAALAYFPRMEKLILSGCGLDNETLAAYRDRVREHYKVVWTIYVGTLAVRTDETTFMPIREKYHVRDELMTDLRYCEDMICVDVGHMGIENLDWIYGMPHLQFLVLADTDIKDITPIGTLEELIYLELFRSPGVTDYTPLLNCTALQDVNLAYTNGDAETLAKLTWVNYLWANCCNFSAEEKQMLRDSLPDTVLELDSGWHLGNGWRDRENYYIMRDLLGMPYYDWGSKRLKDLAGQGNG